MCIAGDHNVNRLSLVSVVASYGLRFRAWLTRLARFFHLQVSTQDSTTDILKVCSSTTRCLTT